MEEFSVLDYLVRVSSFIEEILEAKNPDLLARVKNLESGEEESDEVCKTKNAGTLEDVVEMLDLLLQCDYPKLPLDFARNSGKSLSVSERHREIGNNFLKQGQLVLALDEYNSAILKAPHGAGDTALALALSNRAVCFGKLRKKDLAAKDTINALNHGYPLENSYKLRQRLVKLYEELDDIESARKAISDLESSLELSKLSSKKKNDVLLESKQSLIILERKAAQKSESYLNLAPLTNEVDQCIEYKDDAFFAKYLETPEGSPDIPGGSDAAMISYSPTKGRHAVAARDIDVGEVILADDPVVHLLLPEFAISHCLGCGMEVAGAAVLPCCGCCSVVFCSEECRKEMEESHVYECRLNFLRLYGAEKSRERQRHPGDGGGGNLFLIHLALRIVLQREPQFFLDKSQDFFSSRQSSNIPEDAYAATFNLETNHNHLDLIWNAASALFMFGCLERCGFLDSVQYQEPKLEHFQDGRSKLEVYFAFLLFHFYAVAQCNNHGTQEIVGVDKSVSRLVTGSVLYPHVASALNHSCDPNTVPVVVRKSRRQVNIASRIIKKGEEICHVYQGHFGDTARAERRRVLQRDFHFWCQCPACLDDFPMAKQIPRLFSDDPKIVREIGQEEAEKLDQEYQTISEKISEAQEKGKAAEVMRLYQNRTKLCCETRGMKPPHAALLIGRAAMLDQLWLALAARADGKKAANRLVTNVYY